MSEDFTLAVETGVGGGSISIFENRTLIDSDVSERNVSRSEELLADINSLLKKNGIAKSDITLIAISNGPGSFTGLRIGFGVVYGLQDGLGINCKSVSVLQAMTLENRNKEKVLAGFLYSKNEVCWQSFDCGSAINEPQITTHKDFLAEIMRGKYNDIIINQALRQFLDEEKFADAINLTVIENLSSVVGLSCINGIGSDKDNIKYISKIP